jgi:hypothetical protein
VTLQKVDVKVDAQGNVYIDAPGYKIEVQPPAPGAYPTPGVASNPAFAPASGGYPTPSPGGYGAPVPGPGGYPMPSPTPGYPPAPTPGYPTPTPGYPTPTPAPGGYGAPTPAPYAAPVPTPPPAPMAPYPNGIARGAWWLVTDDKGSIGHAVEVHVNGQLVQTVKSGEPQRIIDIGMFVKPGPNNIECKAFSSQDNNGILYLYLGSGKDQQGTVKMDPPQVQFGVGTNTTFMNTRSYTLNVQ